ncbi:CLUMA_CG012078, isoform A [Clunio marinus]|uniref:Large ribosomal subunit protein bL19m n=1 Tax=Clunio marinus TaxID=568069 RepID=A0A1J1IFL6_9DIPT|nr:CLUMA_CG012078, isoform A [Clunio marinus]
MIRVLQRQINRKQNVLVRYLSAQPESEAKESNVEQKILKKKSSFISPEYRFQYQEFLPDPQHRLRNSVREALERKDMLSRRTQIYIPEFYVGSIVAATSSDPHSQGKTNRFLGICIDRERCGLKANFILRNVIDHQGIEIKFEMYDPTLQKIEVIKLEKRLDEKLYYLRDALPEYSTFDLNMEPELIPEGSQVPVNPLKVQLKPRPWLERWERQELKGVEDINQHLYDKHRRLAAMRATPWEKYDLMKEYRKSIPEEEQKKIFSEIFSRMKQINDEHKKNMKAKRSITKPKTLA